MYGYADLGISNRLRLDVYESCLLFRSVASGLEKVPNILSLISTALFKVKTARSRPGTVRPSCLFIDFRLQPGQLTRTKHMRNIMSNSSKTYRTPALLTP